MEEITEKRVLVLKNKSEEDNSLLNAIGDL